MERMKNSLWDSIRWKPLIIQLVLVGLVIFCLARVSYKVIDFARQKELERQFIQFVETVNMRCDEIAILTGDSSALVEFVNRLDSIYNVYAAAYDRSLIDWVNYKPLTDECLLTKRHPDVLLGRTVLFNPFDHVNLLKLWSKDKTGIIMVDFGVRYDDGKLNIYPTPVYHRRIDIEDSQFIVAMAVPFIPDCAIVPDYIYSVMFIVFAVAAFVLSSLIAFVLHIIFPQKFIDLTPRSYINE